MDERWHPELDGHRSVVPNVPPIAPWDVILFQRAPEPLVILLRPHVEEIRFDPAHALHSPTGFEWGYGGSGPAELARYLTIGVARHLGISPDLLDYQEVKWKVVAGIPRAGGMVSAWRIYEALGLVEHDPIRPGRRASARSTG